MLNFNGLGRALGARGLVPRRSDYGSLSTANLMALANGISGRASNRIFAEQAPT
jgi:hypothetical protein